VVTFGKGQKSTLPRLNYLLQVKKIKMTIKYREIEKKNRVGADQTFQLAIRDRDIFIFDGGNKRRRNVTNLYCQCQISQRRS
jgi:hypothetical protein